ncbi:MAG: hypothetical protein L0Y54_20045, partial [Sporichthyaceae bacterium]|nr:hypothetical protein [Sporichthyaceae bacterium]
GNRTSAVDPRNNTTNFCYDVGDDGQAVAGSRGNLTRIIQPPPSTGAARPTTLLAYDATDFLTQLTAPRGVATGATVTCTTDLAAARNTVYTDVWVQDGLGGVFLTEDYWIDPELSGVQAALTRRDRGDAANPGAITSYTPARGSYGGGWDWTKQSRFTYFGPGSKAGLLRTAINAYNDTTTYDYDPVGRKIQTVNPLGHAWDFEYDREDRLRFHRAPAPTTGAPRLVTESRYDVAGYLEARVDAAGSIRRFLYDERNLLKEVQESPTQADPANDPSKLRTTHAYDDLGTLQRVVRAAGTAEERATDTLHDGLGRLRKEVQYPNWPATTPTLVTEYTYDAAGNLTRKVQPDGRTTDYTYDPLNRLTRIDYADAATADVTLAYDANGNRTSRVDGTGTTSYAYDERDKVKQVWLPGAGDGFRYRYNADGQRRKLIYPAIEEVTYDYDNAGRLEFVTGLSQNRVAQYRWRGDDKLWRHDNVNGTIALY